jgi:hypothetical protein
VAVGSWYFTTEGYDYSDYTPASGSQTSSYTQTRTYKRKARRDWTYKYGSTLLSTRSNYDTQTGKVDTRTVAVTSSGWSDSGSLYDCSSWTPAASGYYTNESVTQTASCSQKQTNTYTHKSGSTTVYTNVASRVVDDSKSQTVSGTKVLGEWSAGVYYDTYSAGSFASLNEALAEDGYYIEDSETKSGTCSTIGEISYYVSVAVYSSYKGYVYHQTCEAD